ncbi:MAG: GNAT family N-acetyltransferase [Gemmatimonadaceae bacterium]|nr:GNAT family N-acetyltransferase [Gemmatimonadaceae bacterium]
MEDVEGFVVRSVIPEDFAAWQVLWDGYNAFYGREGATALPAAVTQMTWSRFFDAYEPVHAMVAERAGRLLGLVHYLFHRNTTQIPPVCYLQDLFTIEEARGRGVGRALIEAVYERARSAGVQRVYWQTHETNTHAMLLYDKIAERSGFVVYRKRCEARRAAAHGQRPGERIAGAHATRPAWPACRPPSRRARSGR